MENLGASFKIDVTQLKAGITLANKLLRENASEFKKTASSLGDWSKSTDGVKARIDMLNNANRIQEEKVRALTSEYKSLVAGGLDPTSARAVDLRTKINNENATLEKNKKELTDCKEALKNMSNSSNDANSAVGKLETTIEKQERKLDQLAKEYAETALTMGKNSTEAKELKSEYDALEKELGDNKKKLDDVTISLDKSTDAADKANGGFTVFKGALANLASSAIQKCISGLSNLARETFQVGMNFDSAMSKVSAVSGATGDDIEKLRNKAQEMGSTTKFSATESAEAFNYMAMAGWKTEDMLNGIEGILNLAAASGSDLATTSDIVTDALTAMGYSAGDAGRLADVMAAASSNANTNVEMMGLTFQYAAPIVGALGYSMEDTALAIGLMANAGIKGEKAGTALRSILTRLSAPPKECAEAMEALGISMTDEQGKMKSLNEIMGDLRQAFGGLSETQQTQYAKSIAGQEAMSGLLAVVNAAPEDFNKLSKAVNNSTGAAKKMADTMNDNVSGQITLLKSNIESKMIKVFDKASASIKKAVGNMSKSLDSINWDKIGDAVGKLAEKFANFVGFVARNTPQIITVLKTLGTVMLGVFAVNKIATFTNSIKTLAPAFTSLAAKIGITTLATEGQTAATLGLNAAWLANPITWVIAGLAALTAGIIAYTSYVNKQIEAEYGLTDAQKATLESVNQLKSEYDQMNESRVNSTNAVNEEFAHINGLKDEYNSLIDANGNVKEGYEDRANFIVNELAKAMGVEVDQIRAAIDENGKLGDSIDKLIEKKHAEALLNANQEAYNDAISKRTEAFNTFIDAQNAATEAEKKWFDVQEAYNEVMANYNHILKSGSPEAAQSYLMANNEIVKGAEEAKKAYEDTQKGLKEAGEAYSGYNSTIANYEGLSSAIISGDTDKINLAMQNMTVNFKTAETSNRESLEQQVKDMQTNYDNLKTAIDNNSPYVTQAMVDQAKGMVTASENELMKLEGKASATGQQSGLNFGLNLGAQSQFAAYMGADVANSADNAIHSTGDFGGAGSEAGGAYAFGVASKQGDAKNAGEDLADNAYSGSKSYDAGETPSDSGSFFGEGFFNGIGSWLTSVWEKGKELAKSALNGLKKGQQEGSPSKLTKKSGVFFGQGYEIGINDTLKDVVNSASNLAFAAYDALNNNTSNFDALGINAGSSFVNGLNSSLLNVNNSFDGLNKVKIKGGVISGATNAIARNDGSSNIISVENNKELIKAVAVEIGQQMKESGRGDVIVNQTNNYSQAHSRYELFQTKQDTAAAVKAALQGV